MSSDSRSDAGGRSRTHHSVPGLYEYCGLGNLSPRGVQQLEWHAHFHANTPDLRLVLKKCLEFYSWRKHVEKGVNHLWSLPEIPHLDDVEPSLSSSIHDGRPPSPAESVIILDEDSDDIINDSANDQSSGRPIVSDEETSEAYDPDSPCTSEPGDEDEPRSTQSRLSSYYDDYESELAEPPQAQSRPPSPATAAPAATAASSLSLDPVKASDERSMLSSPSCSLVIDEGSEGSLAPGFTAELINDLAGQDMSRTPSNASCSWRETRAPCAIQHAIEKTIGGWEKDESLGVKATQAAVLYVNSTRPFLKQHIPEWKERAVYIHMTWRRLPSEERQIYVQKARHNRRLRDNEDAPNNTQLEAENALMGQQEQPGAYGESNATTSVATSDTPSNSSLSSQDPINGLIATLSAIIKQTESSSTPPDYTAPITSVDSIIIAEQSNAKSDELPRISSPRRPSCSLFIDEDAESTNPAATYSRDPGASSSCDRGEGEGIMLKKGVSRAAAASAAAEGQIVDDDEHLKPSKDLATVEEEDESTTVDAASALDHDASDCSMVIDDEVEEAQKDAPVDAAAREANELATPSKDAIDDAAEVAVSEAAADSDDAAEGQAARKEGRETIIPTPSSPLSKPPPSDAVDDASSNPATPSVLLTSATKSSEDPSQLTPPPPPPSSTVLKEQVQGRKRDHEQTGAREQAGESKEAVRGDLSVPSDVAVEKDEIEGPPSKKRRTSSQYSSQEAVEDASPMDVCSPLSASAPSDKEARSEASTLPSPLFSSMVLKEKMPDGQRIQQQKAAATQWVSLQSRVVQPLMEQSRPAYFDHHRPVPNQHMRCPPSQQHMMPPPPLMGFPPLQHGGPMNMPPPPFFNASRPPGLQPNVQCAFACATPFHPSEFCPVFSTVDSRFERRTFLRLCLHCLGHHNNGECRIPPDYRWCPHCGKHKTHVAFCKNLS